MVCRYIPQSHICWWDYGHLCDHKETTHRTQRLSSLPCPLNPAIFFSPPNIKFLFSSEYWIFLFSEYWIFHGWLVGGFMGSYPWLANSYPPYRTRTSLPSIGKWVPMQMLRPDYTNPCARPLYVQMYVQITYVYVCIVYAYDQRFNTKYSFHMISNRWQNYHWADIWHTHAIFSHYRLFAI